MRQKFLTILLILGILISSNLIGICGNFGNAQAAEAASLSGKAKKVDVPSKDENGVPSFTAGQRCCFSSPTKDLLMRSPP